VGTRRAQVMRSIPSSPEMSPAVTSISSPELEAEGTAAPSPAGPATDDGTPPAFPPSFRGRNLLHAFEFATRPMSFALRARRDLGEVFQVYVPVRKERFVFTSHPDHVRSLFTARPDDAPSMTGESPLRPILGPKSVLTAVGERHMRQRKFLLPSFHGDAVRRYAEMIGEVVDREIDRWPVGRPFPLVPRMQAITLDVILSAIFGIEGRPPPGTPEQRLRSSIRRFLGWSTNPLFVLADLWNLGRDEPRGVVRLVVEALDRRFYEVIAARRAGTEAERGPDVLSLLLSARDEEGEPLTDRELRDELMTLVLAGHETTANSLAWTFERLMRTPEAYDRLREAARSGEDADGYVEATVHEGMRLRPVIPIIVRRVMVPWQLGEFRLPARSAVAISILLVHLREDVYPDPLEFRPERFVGRSPGTYTWIPFGGGIRRCLGAALAMAEQRVVLEAIARRTDMTTPNPAHEQARQRNVTMIPGRGGRVVVTAKDPGS
jgi:cytochrome P450 family 135